MPGGGGSENVTQTNKVELTPEQRELMSLGMGQIKGALSNGTPQLPSVQGFDPLQTQAQNSVVAKAGGPLQDMSTNLASAQNFLTKDAIDVNNNKYLKGAVDAAVRPITENFQNIVMPGLRTEAVSAGALGSPKANARAQTASDQYLRQVGDTSAGMYSDAYGKGLDALAKGVVTAPSSMQASLFPEAATESVGAQRRELDRQIGSQGFNQSMLPLSIGSQLISAAAGAPGAGSTSSVSGAQPQAGWTQLLGTGLTAASALAGLPIFM